MTRKSAYLLWLAALMIGWNTPASAQFAGTTGSTAGSLSSAPSAEDGNLIVSMVKAGGEEFTEQMRAGTPLGLRACIQGEIEVSISGLPNSPLYPYLEVWYATGNGACNQADRATRVVGAQNCTPLEHSRQNEQINSFSIFNTTVKIGPVCRLNSDQTNGAAQGPQTLFFLLLQSRGSAEAAAFYKAFTIRLDTDPPPAPDITEAGEGQTDIRLKWTLPTMTTNFYLAADYSMGALASEDGGDNDAGLILDAGATPGGNGCSSQYLRAGNDFDPDARPPGLLVTSTDSIATEWSFNGMDFRGAKKVPVVVVAQDLAGNLSVQSQVACLTVTPTTGFWDRYQQGGAEGKVEPGCACSTPGAHAGKASAWLAAPFALLVAGAFARRRIRRRAR
jgi:MYXO-CTERM domain-containing protein